MLWYKPGKSSKCVKYQIDTINRITCTPLIKMKMRITIFTYQFLHIKQPWTSNNEIEFSEDFDGFIDLDNIKYYFNLKFICGCQTRSIYEVYHFICAQIKILKANPHIRIINILDGNTYNTYNKYFKYLYQTHAPKHIQKNIYIGDCYNFRHWWENLSDLSNSSLTKNANSHL